MQVRVKEDNEQFGMCGCGRNAGGKCVGWHNLSEDDWNSQRVQLQHNLRSNYSEKTYVISEEDTGEQ